MMRNESVRKASLPNLFSLLLFTVIAVSPFLGFLARKVIDQSINQILVLFLMLAVGLILIEKYRINLPLYVIFYLLFAIYTILSDYIIVDKPINFTYFYDNLIFSTVVVILVIENTTISKKFFRFLFILNHIVLFIGFAVMLIQQFYDRLFFVDPSAQEFISKLAFTDTRFPSIYSWVGSVAILGLCFFPILGLQIAHHLKHNIRGLVYLFLIGAIVAFISKSRFIMVNYFFLFLLIPIYKGFNLRVFVKYTLIVSAFSVTLYFGSKSVGFDVDKIVQERILEKKSGGMIKGNVGTRILAVKIFKDLFPKNPVFGKGKLHSFSKAGSKDFELLNALRGRSSQIHVGYLSLFYYYGILGGVIFLFSMFFLFRYTYQTGLLKNCWGPLFGISQFLLTNITGVVLYLFIMGIMMSLIYNKYYIDQEA